MSSWCIGVDVGTQSIKALVTCADTQRVLGRGSYALELLENNGVSGRAEQNPEEWFIGLKDAVQAALKQARESYNSQDVIAIAISGQQHGMVALDSRGEVVRPAKLWCDTEAYQEALELSQQFGFAVPPGFTAPKILWMMRKEPENYDRTDLFLLPHDYINYRLTGEAVMEAGDASGTALLDLDTRDWDRESISAIDSSLEKKLPPIVSPGQNIGALDDKIADELGIPRGCVVGTGSGDNMMSAVGSGIVQGVRRLTVSLGTSGTLFGYSPKPVKDPSGSLAPFCDCTGGYLPLLCTQNCTLVAQEIVDMTGLSHNELTKLAGDCVAGCEGLIFLPYLTGERTPNWPHSSGAICGIRPGMLSKPGLLYRAAMEGATFSILAGLQRFRDFHVEADELLCVGGGSANSLWRQVIADASQLPVITLEEKESAAYGAALLANATFLKEDVAKFVRGIQLTVTTTTSPDSSNKAAYEEAFRMFQDNGASLFDRSSAKTPNRVSPVASRVHLNRRPRSRPVHSPFCWRKRAASHCMNLAI